MNQQAAFTYNPPAHPFLTVLHQDDAVLAVDKPSGLLTVPGKPPTHRDCLERRVQETYPSARIVHRLDCETSGVLVLGRTTDAHRHLSRQFERRAVRKIYIARVWGHMNQPEGEIDLPLACDWPNRPRQHVDHERGKSSQTQWRVLSHEQAPDGTPVTRVELTPLTGRSHQLRVHMMELGHPILGDPLYAHHEALAASQRLHLHAERLTVHHPDTSAELTFHAPVPF